MLLEIQRFEGVVGKEGEPDIKMHRAVYIINWTEVLLVTFLGTVWVQVCLLVWRYISK
jgi:hypothetical protein